MGIFQTVNVGKITHVGDKTATSTAVQVFADDVSGNALFAAGTVVPADATAGFAVGCDFIKTDAASGEQSHYTNGGSATSSSFRPVAGATAGWSITAATIGTLCTNGSTTLPVPLGPSGFKSTDPAFMHFSTTDDGDYVVEEVNAATVLGIGITPELSADPLSAHAVQVAFLQQGGIPGFVCTHAGTIATVADSSGVATNDITVTGAAVGDLAFACFSVTDDSDQLGGAVVSAADTLTVTMSADPSTTHTVAYAVFAPAGRAAAAYRIAFAGQHTSTAVAANAVAITGALATDVAIAQVGTKGSTPRTIVSTLMSAGVMTITFAGDPSTDHVVPYMILRAV